MTFTDLVIGVFIGLEFAAFIWFLKHHSPSSSEPGTVTPREAIRNLSKEIVQKDWRPMTVSKVITNVNFEEEDTEYRTVLKIETMKHFRERTSDED